MSKERVAAERCLPLAPSKDLLANFKQGMIEWDEYVQRFHEEMESPAAKLTIAGLARAAQAGETITLLCECSAGPGGEEAIQCHRRLVKDLILQEIVR